MKQSSKRSIAALQTKFAVAFASLTAVVLLQPGFAHAAAMVDTIVVKYRDDALPQDATRLPDGDRALLGHLRKANFVEIGRSRDGAFRIAVDPPLSIDEARAAMNRMRLNPAVLYVSVAERNEISKSTAAAMASAGNQRPVRALIVKYRDAQLVANALADRPLPTAQLQRAADVARMPVATLRTMGEGQYLVQFFKSMSVSQAFNVAAQLENDAEVEYASPDLWKSPTLTPNDTCYATNTNAACHNSQFFYYMHEWHLMPGGTEVGGANLPPAWDLTTGSASITIGVIDTGYLPNHPDLAGRFVAGYDFIYDFALGNDSQPVQTAACLQGNDPTKYDPLKPPCVSSRDNDPSDPGDWIEASDLPTNMNSWFVGCPIQPSSWHGSHTAGTIGALSNNGQGIAGINWVSKLQSLRALGKCGGYTSDIVDAIIWGSGGTVPGIAANPTPARVLNLSLGGSGPCDPSEQAAINDALSRGTVVVISAGNSNANASNLSPGNCHGNITVAASQRQGIKAQYSSFGLSVDIAAPGGGNNYPTNVPNRVISAFNSGTTTPNPSGYIYWGYQGTSQAAPHVAGVASLMLSRNPTLTPAHVLSLLQTTARAFPVVAGATCPSSQSCNCTTALCGAGLLDAGAAVTAAATPPVGLRTPIDFNEDGKDDLAWRNSATGATSLWLMNGTTYLSFATVFADPSYAVTNTGDLNGDGMTDLIWRHTSGATVGWLMNGLTYTSFATLLANPNWVVVRMADFNGDLKEDLLWRNTATGQTAIWLMNGLAPTTSAIIFSNPNWQVTRIGDFSADGKADLLWRNTTTGQTAIWLMNGLTVTLSAVIWSDPNWTVTNIGDFNGDGLSDLVWRNTAGQTAIWLMGGVTPTSSAVIFSSLNWAVTHVGDFNGDGRSDLVWRNNTTGQTAVWLMNGTTTSSSAVVFTDTAWSVTHVADTNGDGKSDLLWRNSVTGATAVWLMDGTSLIGNATLLTDPQWALSPPDGF